MVREDLINSAVSFLQDPSVASAPLEKRIAFLQSKNLTQEEIDISLARASESSGAPASPPQASAPSNYAYRQPPPPPPGYGAYPGYWPQPPPREVPRRDWRDWFIMATVLGGVGYGIYFTAKRYIVPLIAPPTPPQLEQDKAAIDAKFERAFALLDQLETDTKALKAAEEERTQRLDAALAEMETVITSLKDSSRRRDDDNRRMEDDIRNLGLLVPKALDAHKESTASQLRDLATELKSLKTLVSNRMGSTSAAPSRPVSGTGVLGTPGNQAANRTVNGTAASSAAPAGPPAASGTAASTSSAPDASSAASPAAAEQPRPYSPYSRLTNGKASIPAWQMAAAKRSQDQDGAEENDASESGAATEASTAA